jgi:hypothetical protein
LDWEDWEDLEAEDLGGRSGRPRPALLKAGEDVENWELAARRMASGWRREVVGEDLKTGRSRPETRGAIVLREAIRMGRYRVIDTSGLTEYWVARHHVVQFANRGLLELVDGMFSLSKIITT